MTEDRPPIEASEPATYGDRRLVDLLGLVAERSPSPGGGSVAAIAVSLAAALVEMAATYAEGLLDDADAVVAESSRLRCRALELADADAAAYRQVIAVSKGAQGQEADGPAVVVGRIRAAWLHASEVPLEIAELGAATAALAARVWRDGRRSLRGDAATALLLAEGGVRAAALLVTINVEGGDLDAELSRRARQYVDDVSGQARSSRDCTERAGADPPPVSG